MVIFGPASVIGGALGGSFRAGVQTAVWATVLATLVLVVAWLAVAPSWYASGGGLLLDAEGGIPVGVNLPDAAYWGLVHAVWAFSFGVVGAALGARLTRHRTATTPRRVLIG